MSHGDKLHAVPEGFTKVRKVVFELVGSCASPHQETKLPPFYAHLAPLARSSLGASLQCGSTANAEFVAIQNLDRKMWGLQFHPEVTHSPMGPVILSNFVVKVCKSPTDWVMTDYAEEFIENVRKQVRTTEDVG